MGVDLFCITKIFRVWKIIFWLIYSASVNEKLKKKTFTTVTLLTNCFCRCKTHAGFSLIKYYWKCSARNIIYGIKIKNCTKTLSFTYLLYTFVHSITLCDTYKPLCKVIVVENFYQLFLVFCFSIGYYYFDETHVACFNKNSCFRRFVSELLWCSLFNCEMRSFVVQKSTCNSISKLKC